MKRFQRTLAACALGLLSLNVVAAEPSRPASATKGSKIIYSAKSDIKLTDERLKQLLEFMKLRSVLFTPAYTCVLQTGGVCVIDVSVILVQDSGGQQYCVGLFPEVVKMAGTLPGNAEKSIVWNLIPPSPAPANATFTFFDDITFPGKASGIIILSDKNKQLHGGMLGDGTATPPDATKYLFKNKHKVQGDTVYIPIVVRTDDPGKATQKISVCGTPDPTISNVP